MLTHELSRPVRPDRVVVVGAGGFVGSAIVRRLKVDGVEHVALTRREVDLLGENVVADLASFLQPQDAVVVVSAIAPVKAPAQLVANLQMAEAVGEVLAAVPVGHCVYISSDAVYADSADPITESTACEPTTLHGMMHAARELMLKTAVKSPMAILRPSLLYGADDPHNGYGPNRFRRMAQKGEAIALFGQGEEKRDHVFVDDVARLVALALAHRSRGVLNVATGVSTSFCEVAEKVCASVGRSVPIAGSPRQNPITHRFFDIVACHRAFPAFRYTPLDEGLAISAQAASVTEAAWQR